MAVTSRSDVLYAVDFRQKLAPLLGPGEPSFSRAGAARLLTAEGRYAKLRRDQYRGRWTPLDLDESGVLSRRKGLLVEDAISPVNDDSVRFDPANSAWSLSGGGTPSDDGAVSSIFSDLPTDGEARQFSSSGSAGDDALLRQSVNGSTGSTEVAVAVFENVDSDLSQVGLLDDTGVYAQIRYDWTTESVNVKSGVGAGEVLCENGPNGGRVVRLVITGIGNNTTGRQLLADPVVDTASGTAIIHYAHADTRSFATSPIPYVGSPQSRVREDVTIEPAFKPADFHIYTSWIMRTDSDAGDNRKGIYSFSNGNLEGHVRDDGTNINNIAIDISDGSGNNDPEFHSGAIPHFGDLVQHVLGYVRSTGERHSYLKVRSAAVDHRGSTPSSWSDTDDSPLNLRWNEYSYSGGHRGSQLILRQHAVKSSALDTAIDGSAPETIMDEMAGIHVGPNGRVVSLNT